MKHLIQPNAIKPKLVLPFLLVSFAMNGQLPERIDSLALAYSSKGFNGNVLYSKNDSIIFTGNYGYSDFSKQRRLEDSTIFELASCPLQQGY